jgi:hypothetical protein
VLSLGTVGDESGVSLAGKRTKQAGLERRTQEPKKSNENVRLQKKTQKNRRRYLEKPKKKQIKKNTYTYASINTRRSATVWVWLRRARKLGVRVSVHVSITSKQIFGVESRRNKEMKK